MISTPWWYDHCADQPLGQMNMGWVRSYADTDTATTQPATAFVTVEKISCPQEGEVKGVSSRSDCVTVLKGLQGLIGKQYI